MREREKAESLEPLDDIVNKVFDAERRFESKINEILRVKRMDLDFVVYGEFNYKVIKNIHYGTTGVKTNEEKNSNGQNEI